MKIVARPKNNPLFISEKNRLTVNLHNALKQIKDNPSVDTLAKVSASVGNTLSNSIIRIAGIGYELGCSHIQTPLDKTVLLRLNRDSALQARLATTQITHATANAYGIVLASISPKRAASKGRSDFIAGYELTNSFNRGMRVGWSVGKTKYRKSWLVSDDHDTDDVCDENEEQGPIPIDEEFTSGDMEPLAHLSCECELVLEK